MKHTYYDIAVIGAGAAGCMAAIRASQLGKRVVLIERNDCIGKKIALTGNRRCNVTNTASLDEYIQKFSPGGEFYRTAFSLFFHDESIGFLKRKGLNCCVQAQGRVFPSDDTAESVITVFRQYLKEHAVSILYNTRVVRAARAESLFALYADTGLCAQCEKLIVSTGGASYAATGSSGDGFDLAAAFGHRVLPLKPGLVPLRVREPWVKELQGVSLDPVRLSFFAGKKKYISGAGPVLFTHYGVSGPMILDMSRHIIEALDSCPEIVLSIDMLPDREKASLDADFLAKHAEGKVSIDSFLHQFIPKRAAALVLDQLQIDPAKPVHQITRAERQKCVEKLKSFKLTVTGSLPLSDAMVTAGGVAKKELDPRTMESRLVPGLYFAGEIIEGAGPSGGYNLQQAFSTGYLAGSMAAR